MEADLAIIGMGASGLAAGIFAAELLDGSDIQVVGIDGAKRLGAKILASGGGRCNVCNKELSPDDYSGGPRNIIKKVLMAFDQNRTQEWMAGMRVPLREEDSGKLYPESRKAISVLNALESCARNAGVQFMLGKKALDILLVPTGFSCQLDAGDGEPDLTCKRLIVAAGGLSMPNSGSDGSALHWLRRLGHTIVPPTPALSPLVLLRSSSPGGRFAEFAGITMDARLALFGPRGEKIRQCSGSIVFTHFGISGPAALDFSRHLLRFRLEHPGVEHVVALGHPNFQSLEEADAWLQNQARRHPRKSAATILCEIFPERLARAIAQDTGPISQINRAARLSLARGLVQLPIEVVADRGYHYAEATAGGVDLREINANTMESRKIPGLYLCGELLDVDGRIGGYNLQWAWSSGYLAGRSAALSLLKA